MYFITRKYPLYGYILGTKKELLGLSPGVPLDPRGNPERIFLIAETFAATFVSHSMLSEK